MGTISRPNCSACSKLDISTARLKHCWDEKRCHNRRSYQRNKTEVNRKRSKLGSVEVIDIEAPQTYHGILQLWREPREDAPLHAVGVEVKLSGELIATIAPVHCAGWMPSQVYQYLDKVLELMNQNYQFKKFSSTKILPPSCCAIETCSRE